jgi:hypothetical protein
VALLLLDVVNQPDLTEIMEVHESGDGHGQRLDHPVMLVPSLLYAHCSGTTLLAPDRARHA